jgi:hypothetical protein
MVSGEAVLIAVAFAALWYAGHETVKGVKKMDHAIAAKLHRHKQQPAVQPQKETP